jgi:hypothetical protein
METSKVGELDGRTTMTDRNQLLRRTATGALVVGAVAVAVLSLRESDSNAAAAPAQAAPGASTADDHPGWWGGPWNGPWAGGWGTRNPLHGEVVVAKDGGGTETILFQRGEVTDVRDTAVTVRSDDGVTTTFTVNADTKVNGGRDKIGSVAKTEQVIVTAPKSGDHPTATTLIDLTDLGHR